MDSVDCVVVGAGVVGLAVARELARAGREVLVLESESTIGCGVSSRNSCVIHAGIYYAHDSVKAHVCVDGKHRLYAFCAEHGVDHQRIGKLIIATDAAQLAALEGLRAQAAANGVGDLRFVSRAEVAELEPALDARGALLSPSTGIVDVHEFMLALEGDAESHGAMVVLETPFVRGRVAGNRFEIETGGAEPMTLACNCLINSGGLGAQAVACALEGLDPARVPQLYPAKGNYYSLLGKQPFNRLIYPMPDGAWLGVHVTLDLAGRCRFGPDLQWLDGVAVEDLDYDVDLDQLPAFYESIRRWWPDLPDGALQPDYSGIRPKIYAPGQPAADFLVQTSAQHGIPGLINLFGIESPGLTSAMSIADSVRAQVLARS